MHHRSSPHTHTHTHTHTVVAHHTLTTHHIPPCTQKQLLHHFPFCSCPASLPPLYVSPTETLKIEGRGGVWHDVIAHLLSSPSSYSEFPSLSSVFDSQASLPLLTVQFQPLELKHGICFGLRLTLSHSFDPIPLIPSSSFIITRLF